MKKTNLNLLLKLLISFGFTLISFSLSAQVKTKIFNDSIPQNLKPHKVSIGKTIQLDPPANLGQLKRGQFLDTVDFIERKNQFAVSLPTDINFLSVAEKIEEQFYTIFVLTVIAKQALNISLEFSDFGLSQNSVLSLFTKKELTDSITCLSPL